MAKVYYGRDRKTDNFINPWDWRTYQQDYINFFFIGAVISLITLLTAFCYMFHITPLHLFNEYDRLRKLLIYSAIGLGLLFSYLFTPKIRWTEQSSESENFYYNDTDEANEIFHQEQSVNYKLSFNKEDSKTAFVLLDDKECKGKRYSRELKKNVNKEDFYKPIVINETASIFSHLVIGLAGGGKSVLIDRMYESALENGHKLIMHAPDTKARDSLIASGYSCAISAPWFKDSIYIDIFEILLNEPNELNRTALIDLIITSIFGVVDNNSANAFFENGAKYILTATLRKMCFEYKEEEQIKEETIIENGVEVIKQIKFKQPRPTITDWKNELNNYKKIYQFKDVVDTYFPEAGFVISEDSEKMTGSIIASMTTSLVMIGLLSDYYKNNRKSFDLKSWCIDEDFDNDKQIIILCSDNINMEVSRANIALFVNLATKFLQSDERLKSFNKTGRRVYQALDEFPVFAKYIDVAQWLDIINLGRKYGNTAIVLMQNTSQMAQALNHKEETLKSFLTSFHSQYIATPGSQEDKYLSKIVGEVTYIDTEFTSSVDSNGRQNTSMAKKPRKVNIEFKQLQKDLGFKVSKDKENLGLNIAVRLYQSKSVCVLFFPFLNELGKANRDKLRKKGEIIKDIETGKEYFVYYKKGKKFKKPLFLTENYITFDKNSTSIDIYTRQLASLQNTKEKMIKDKNLKDLTDINTRIEILEKLLDINTNNEVEEKTITDIATHTLEPTGTASIVLNAVDMIDELTSFIETEQVAVNVNTTNETSKIKLKKKEIERD